MFAKLFSPIVPVGAAGPDLLVPFEQDVIASPGVDGEALQRAEFVQRPDYGSAMSCFPVGLSVAAKNYFGI